MNGYLCLKRVKLSGVVYLPGDPVPAEAVLASRVRALKQMGYITDAQTPAPSVTAEPDSAEPGTADEGRAEKRKRR